MDDLISREALLKDIEEIVVFSVRPDKPSAEIRGANKILDRIKAAPSVDAVEVVRCGCCNFCTDHRGVHFCIKWRSFPEVELDDFCSYGERKEDDATD